MSADSSPEVAIQATGIVKNFGHLEALRGADVRVHKGEILAIVGDNGAGKSTLAKIICGALAPDGGELSFWGEPVEVQSIAHAYDLGLGVVYQDLSLALDLSVADNLFLGREPREAGWRGWAGMLNRDRMREEARAALARLGIKVKSMNVPVRNLSGGQRQALAVARAMMWAKRAVLMDEPTAALGPKQSAIVFDTVRKAADDGLAVLVISHDIPRMLVVADRIAVMRHGLVVAARDARDLHLNDVIGLMLGGRGACRVTDETLEAATAGRVSDVSEPAPAAEPGTREDSWLDQARRSTAFWIGLVIVAIAVIFGAITPGNSFVKPENLLAIGLNASMIMLLGVGMTYLIGAGHLDLSVGYNLILASVLASKTMVALGGTALEVQSGAYPRLGLALTAGIIVAIASGMAIGTLNGLLVTRLRLSSFIVTLATSGIAYGLSLVLTSAANIPYIPDELQANFGGAKLLGIVPFPLILALVVSGIFWVILRRTRYGLRTLAIGSSRDAALRAGIDVNRHTLKLFIQMGALVGLAALVDISRNANTNVAGHQTDNLQAIAAVVIGGTSLFGGVASIGGTLLGTLIPVMLANGLVQMATNPFYQYALVGIILILAVYFDQRRRERST